MEPPPATPLQKEALESLIRRGMGVGLREYRSCRLAASRLAWILGGDCQEPPGTGPRQWIGGMTRTQAREAIGRLSEHIAARGRPP